MGSSLSKGTPVLFFLLRACLWACTRVRFVLETRWTPLLLSALHACLDPCRRPGCVFGKNKRIRRQTVSEYTLPCLLIARAFCFLAANKHNITTTPPQKKKENCSFFSTLLSLALP